MGEKLTSLGLIKASKLSRLHCTSMDLTVSPRSCLGDTSPKPWCSILKMGFDVYHEGARTTDVIKV